ncbi:CD225/dispanin family protein [Marinirhabdus gelatinilytica]|uniref:Interferon-induced transmembrane protein n=1 Tax=Marinirhabdus gelatinilytica TaxID=1703343 RepID=A0A370QK39_9FLAO|nr:CD225/dispanin family protein [Marinirhabdus gelatinilytica]RDK88696.1 interferon-induced transmembrane protein [Marinirhabdus gelatinilytica]
MNPTQQPPPDNNMVWAILSTVLCCLPLGIVAIIKASKVEQLWYQGFHAEAHKAADDAKKWSIYSAVSIGVLVVLYILVALIIFGIQGAANF